MNIDRSDAGKGYHADCTENDIFLRESPILFFDVSFILQVNSRNQIIPMDHLEKRSAAFMQEDDNQ